MSSDRSHWSLARPARRGGVLLLALVAVIAVSVLAAGFLQLSTAITRRQLASLDGKRAFYMAEAGLAEAYAGLAVGATGNVGSQGEPARYGDGLFWVEATRDVPNEIVTLESTGMVGAGRARLQVVAKRDASSVSSLGVFSHKSTALQPDSLIDGFDSNKGAYADQVDPLSSPPHTGGGGMLGSNADVTIDGGPSGSSIFGTVRYGTLGRYSTSGVVTVSQGSKPRTVNATLPAVEVPPVALAPSLLLTAVVPMVIDGTKKGFSTIVVGRGSELIIRGPATLVVNDLTLVSGARLTLDTSNGQVRIFINGQLNLGAGSVVDTPRMDPKQTSIQVASVGGTQASLHSNSQFYGVVYAPRTGVSIAASFEVYGTVAADSLTLATGVRLHLDTALSSGVGSSGLPTLQAWRILEMPTLIAGNGHDAFDALGVDKNALPSPRQAHEDVWIDVTYKDNLGVLQTYSGFRSAFNLASVTEVSSLDAYTADPGLGGVKIK